MLRFAYNTNGAANHRLQDAVAIIADAGYDGIALTLDIHHIDPLSEGWIARTEALAKDLAARRLGCVIETGARFLLDPRRKHEPTLLTPTPEGRAQRVAFLHRAIDIGAILGAEAVSFWAGVPLPGVDLGEAGGWLKEGVGKVLDHATRRGITAALEPEPGMLVETVDDWRTLHGHLPALTLALDLGHLLVTEERDPPAAVREFAPHLGTVAIEDMRRRDHTHLPFGEGEMDIPACLDALEAIGFRRLVCVELSRESHRADCMIPASLDWLRRCRATPAAANAGAGRAGGVAA
jgi:D-psicose/D-tagatose/L-ribulose 3-epimerase